jgi:hypothetical protein
MTVYASSSPNEPKFLGVWKGTIGSARVVACLTPATNQPASYYYTQHRTSIPLYAPADGGDVWHEGTPDNPKGQWKIASVTATDITGTWSDGQARSLPLKLSRIARVGPPYGDECDSEGSDGFSAFNKSRVDDEVPSIHTEKDKTLVQAGKGEIAIVMPANFANADTVAKVGRAWLDERMASLYACRFHQQVYPATDGRPYQYRYTLSVRSRSRRWLVATQLGSSSCGEDSEVQSDQASFVWDVRTQKRVWPWEWFANSQAGCPTACRYAPSKALQRAIVSLTRIDAEHADCKRYVEENEDYVIWPTSRGVIFEGLVYAARNCSFETEVPYAALQPFLTRDGSAAAQSFQAEAAPELHSENL